MTAAPDYMEWVDRLWPNSRDVYYLGRMKLTNRAGDLYQARERLRDRPLRRLGRAFGWHPHHVAVVRERHGDKAILCIECDWVSLDLDAQHDE